VKLTSLTERQREVAALVAQGLSNRQIAERLTITERTVETHLERAFARLDIGSRAELACMVGEQRRPAQTTARTTALSRLVYPLAVLVVLVLGSILWSACAPAVPAAGQSNPQSGTGWISDSGSLVHRDIGRVRCFRWEGSTTLSCVVMPQ